MSRFARVTNEAPLQNSGAGIILQMFIVPGSRRKRLLSIDIRVLTHITLIIGIVILDLRFCCVVQS